MLALASLCMAYAAVAAAFAGGARAGRRPRTSTSRSRATYYLLALVATAASAALWPRGDGAIMTGICIVLALSIMATLFTLLEPLLGKLVWRIAFATPVIALVAASADWLSAS